MQQLQEYLRFQTNGAALPGSMVRCGDVRITVITPRLIRLEQGVWTDRASTVVLHRDFCPCEFLVSDTAGLLTVKTDDLEVCYRSGTTLREGLTIRGIRRPGFFWHFGDKPLQNLGGTVSTLDTVDGECLIDDGICSTDGFGIMDDSGSALFDEEGWLLPREKTTDVYFFGYGHDYTACVQDYYRLTGVPQMLPAYALGNWWSRYYPYTDREYLDLMDAFQRRDIPLSVGIVDMDWHLTSGEDWLPEHNGWTGYTWNEKLFPDYVRFIRELHERGLRTALNLHPAAGVQSFEKQYPAVAEKMGIDPESRETVPCDYLNPKFLETYFEELHHPYEKNGVDFWWMDWQQGSSYAKIMGKRYQPSGLESVQPLWILNHMHYLSSIREGKRGLIFSRFGGFGSQRYPIGFSGDTIVTWDSLNFQPYFTATASNIGYGWWSHDIGGNCDGVKDDELMARWVQFGVFSPIFRLHSSISPFTSREPWNYNPRAQLVIERFMRLRHRMFPYLYTMCHRDHQQLLPLMRPMYHLYPENPEAYRVKNQYFFGSELMVIPITVKSNGSDLAPVDVWFPEGRWIDAFTGDVYPGGRFLRILRSLEEMPVFMKAGATVPMQTHIPGSRKLGGAEEMELYVAPGDSGQFVLYEDDCESLAYQNGVFCETELTFDWEPGKAALRIHAACGHRDLIPAKRSWTVHFRGMAQDVRFLADGQPAFSRYDPDTHTHTLVLKDIGTDRTAEITLLCDNDILYDNRDCQKRIMHDLIRAQCGDFEKKDLHTYMERLYRYLKAGGVYCPDKATYTTNDSMRTRIWELASIENWMRKQEEQT